MKRFYKMVSVGGDDQNGFVIELDGKPVKTPSGAALNIVTAALAQEIAAEWNAQEDDIDPETMPLTQLYTTAQDRVAAERAHMMPPLMAYLDTDLVCYRTELPQALAERQAAQWDIYIDVFARRYGTTLQTTTGLSALKQDEKAHLAVRDALESLDGLRFTVLQAVTSLSCSLVMALAFINDEASPVQLFDAMHVEESYKAEIYNEDVHGAAPLQEKKQDAARRDLNAARKFLDCLQK